ncbi:hypothetical protein BDR07DRAFT_316411 [Suillus spraguei]|nr:hypothetical protein BDR07DRAFT_316411 [Suillus spraguei]
MVVYKRLSMAKYTSPHSQFSVANPFRMTLVSNEPQWWPLLDDYRIYSYFVVASSTVVVYDWALTFGQEFELVLRQRWSRMTVLYISVPNSIF